MKRNYDYTELYTDYLISSSGLATATGLSAMMDNSVSHDKITRFLSRDEFDSKKLWMAVKKTVREIESDDACLILDDTIQEKAWSEESDMICYHYDHTKGKSVKGLNILNALYYSNDVSIPVAYEIIKKPILYCDIETRQQKRKSEVTKNDIMRSIIKTTIENQLKFRFVLMDSWFASTENFGFITKHKKEFIAALKDNRLFASSLAKKHQGEFVPVSELVLQDKQSIKGYLKGYDKEVLLVRRIFKNREDKVIGELTLVCSDTSLDGEYVSTIYEKRWKVEEFHKSLKSNAALAKSPTKTIRSQANHVFMAIYSVFKLECLKIKTALNHFAFRAKLLIRANQMAFAELQRLKGA